MYQDLTATVSRCFCVSPVCSMPECIAIRCKSGIVAHNVCISFCNPVISPHTILQNIHTIMYSPFIHLDCSRVGTIGFQQHLSLFIEQPPIHAAAIIDRDVSIPAAEMTECFPLRPKENALMIICSGVFLDIHSDLRPNLSKTLWDYSLFRIYGKHFLSLTETSAHINK